MRTGVPNLRSGFQNGHVGGDHQRHSDTLHHDLYLMRMNGHWMATAADAQFHHSD
jgi:hypothetical protein